MKFIDDFIAYNRDFTGCPTPFLEWAAIYCLSVVAGSNQRFLTGNWDIWPNLWILILGNSTSMKSTGLDSAKLLLKKVCPEKKGANAMSTERLIQDIAEQPHRYYAWDEGATLFQMCNQSYNPTMKSFWNTIWRSREFEASTKKETLKIENPYVCLGLVSTPEQLFNIKNKDADFLSGFMARFTLAPYFGPEKYVANPPPHDYSKFSALVEQLTLLHARPERQYFYSAEALKLKDDWVKRLNNRHKDAGVEIAAFFKKMRDEHFHKVCILSAFERNSPEMNENDVLFAINQLWETEKYWPAFLGEGDKSHWFRVTQRIGDLIRKHGILSHSDLLRAMSPVSGEWLQKLIQNLVKDEHVETYLDETGRKPRKMYRWVGE